MYKSRTVGKNKRGEGKPEAEADLFALGAIEVLILPALEDPNYKTREYKSHTGG